MMTLSQQIYKAVSGKRPSCLLTEGVEYTPAELIDCLLHPRGIEHALATGFPSMDLLEEHRDDLAGLPVTLLSDVATSVLSVSGGAYFVAGAGDVTIYVNGAEEGATSLLMMHGAKANIIARGNSVVAIHADSSCDVQVQTLDTAIIL
jgi:hypothetical protein